MKIGKDKNVERQRMYSEINHVGNSALPRKKSMNPMQLLIALN
jgi:hypothetical protein